MLRLLKDPRFQRAGRPRELEMRAATIKRKTKETEIEVSVNLDGKGTATVATGIGFSTTCSIFSRGIRASTSRSRPMAICMSITTTPRKMSASRSVRPMKQALGDMAGITRYASVHMPMDETLTRVVIDISGRPVLVFKADFTRDKIGEFDTDLVREWFQAFATNAGVTLHVETLYGTNGHHIAESCFKGLARVLRTAVAIDPRNCGRSALDQGNARRLSMIPKSGNRFPRTLRIGGRTSTGVTDPACNAARARGMTTCRSKPCPFTPFMLHPRHAGASVSRMRRTCRRITSSCATDSMCGR